MDLLRHDTVELRISELEKRVQQFEQDHNQLVLQQRGYQLQNKLARTVVRSAMPTPYQARHATLQRIQTHKLRDDAALRTILASYPDISDGIEALNALAIPIAHPELDSSRSGQEQVTQELLASLISTHFQGSDALQPVQNVLQCLVDLTQRLGEQLFVDSTLPS